MERKKEEICATPKNNPGHFNFLAGKLDEESNIINLKRHLRNYAKFPHF